jgi:2'-5' RNA ligase
MRSFIGIKLPYSIALNSLVAECREMGKAVNPGNLHLTLKFLGDIQNVDTVRTSLADIRFQRFTVIVKGMGAFPSSKRGRILFVKASPEEKLKALANEVNLRTPEINLDHPFSPHITVLRAKQERDFSKVIENYEDTTFLDFEVDHFTLFESVLHREGPVYNEIMNYQLI